MNMKTRERRRNGMREKPDCQDHQTHLRRGLGVGCCQDKEQKEMEMREGMKEKWNEREARLSRPSNTPGGREERLLK